MTQSTDAQPHRVVIVGAGFAGVHAARRLARLAGHHVEVTLINPTDYFLYLPLLPVPGVARHAHGFRSIAEALYLRDHLLRQLELAEASPDPGERQARCTFVVVGAGYTGTEVAAQGQLLTRDLARTRAGLGDQPVRWVLINRSARVLPDLSPRLSATAHRTLTQRGVDQYLSVPGHPAVFSCGDVAAVPDLTRPGQITGMTAQHAVRQGRLAAGNIAASLGLGTRQAYRHRDLGFVVDLAGPKAAADPLGVPLAGCPAKLVTRGYHLLSLPANRVRVAADWALDAVLPRQSVQFGLVRGPAVPLTTARPDAERDLVAVPDRTS
jgi:NADH dehydrogenase